MLATTRTVIVDEIHALVRDKRGSHLALSLERLEALAGRPIQRIGLSATQKPLEEVGRLPRRARGARCALVDAGSFRAARPGHRDPALAARHRLLARAVGGDLRAPGRADPGAPHDARVREHAEDGRADRGPALDASWARRPSPATTAASRASGVLDAEQRLKAGSLRALVATASLELGIDIGDVDLVLQVGATRSIATLLQRVGRSGHGSARVPKGRLFPLTLDELVEAAALLRCVRDSRARPHRHAARGRSTSSPSRSSRRASRRRGTRTRLFETLRRAWPYRDARARGVRRGRPAARRERPARPAAPRRRRTRRCAPRAARASRRCMSGGAIPDTADYQVRLEPEGTLVGTVNEDWAIESNGGDIFQLGNASWRILRVEPGVVRVADAKGQPPTLPFWLGEGPGANARAVGRDRGPARGVRRRGAGGARRPRGGCGRPAAVRVRRRAAGRGRRPDRRLRDRRRARARRRAHAAPRRARALLRRERRHAARACTRRSARASTAPGASRCASASASASASSCRRPPTRRRSCCRLGPQHSFPLEEVFDYLHPTTARDVLVQALLAAPMFDTRWRWNAQRSLLLERARGRQADPGRAPADEGRGPPGRGLPAGARLPRDAAGRPDRGARRTTRSCDRRSRTACTEAMDVDGFLEVLAALRDGSIERRAVDTPEPSAFARGILSSQPYTFLDDAPLEERRTQAVMARRVLEPRERGRARRARPRAPSSASARRRGPAPRTPRRCTRRSSGWAT